jgi:exodeoxyribonuclease VII large subunit
MNEKLTLTDLQLLIRDSLYIALPEMYWVIAEISEIKENSAGHCYLELIEKHPDENNVRAKIKAIIWSNRYRFIKSLFENITGESIKEGLKILVRAKVEYHEIYGLSLVITDIDPAFTVGELAIKRQQIIHRLEQEGVITMNKEIDFPYAPQRIAVISSKNAAGYTDFIKQLKGNSFGYIFYTALFESAMQGTDLENDIINALNRIADNSEKFDLVVIIRGGGSQADLSWFDNYNLAYHITQFPLPVITGIGHDKDMSVTDLVANKALKTPTATAEFIIECLSDAENHIYEMWQRIREISVQYTSDAGLVLINHASRLTAAAKSFSQTKKYSVDSLLTSLKSKTLNYTNIKNAKLNILEVSLNILNPDNVLKRGYTITSLKGKIIKAKSDLKEDDVIDTTFSDGKVKSRVIRMKGRVGEEEKGLPRPPSSVSQ